MLFMFYVVIVFLIQDLGDDKERKGYSWSCEWPIARHKVYIGGIPGKRGRKKRRNLGV